MIEGWAHGSPDPEIMIMKAGLGPGPSPGHQDMP